MTNRFIAAFAIIVILAALGSFAAQDQNLPDLGDSTSGIISLGQEHQLGQQFLRSLRAQVPMVADPIMQEYVELLLYRLATNSQLVDRRLYVVLINSPVINAFAAPGGVVGINHGLFFYGETEHETSAILAHEIAHLSQRHFARRLEAGKQSGLISMAGLLASVILMTTVGGDAGMAAITTTQGVAQSQRLAYSRNREAEADRIGIATLANSGMDPRAMAYMFERLERTTRYSGDLIPEFLRTHPVTRSRIADAYNQTQNTPNASYPLSLDYQLMRARARVITVKDPQPEIPRFREGMKDTEPFRRMAAQYGLVLALTADAQMDEAKRYLRPLLAAYPDKIIFRIAEANIYNQAQQHDQALAILKRELDLAPGNYPLTMAYAASLMSDRQPVKAAEVLTDLAKSRKNDDQVWFQLAEAYGLANDIAGVHQARAEYFVLNGAFDLAITQLGYALPMVRDNFQQNARIKQRIDDIWEMRRASDRR